MALLDIKIYGESVLRKKSGPIPAVTPELAALAQDMLETMYDAGGCGLAAPQIGKDIRLVVIDAAKPDEEEPAPHIMFNPEWGPEPDAVDVIHEEGCLSIPDIWCDVMRKDKVWVRYTDETGAQQELHNCTDMLGRCIQHECDHLEGKLFIDKMSTTDRSLNQSKLRDMAKKHKKA